MTPPRPDDTSAQRRRTGVLCAVALLTALFAAAPGARSTLIYSADSHATSGAAPLADATTPLYLPILFTGGQDGASPTFAPFDEVPVTVQPNAPAYLPDLDVVVNQSQARVLSEAQRAALEQNGFVVVPAGHKNFHSIYHNNYMVGIPSFVSSDVLLHAMHKVYERALQQIETEHLRGDLARLTRVLHRAALDQRAVAAGPLRRSADETLAFFSVAGRLLDAGFPVPDAVEAAVEGELALIATHQGVARSPIFGYDEDYSQYLPRGHYTRSPELASYFRAMVWYGRMAFHLENRLDGDADFARRQTRGALWITRALLETAEPAGTAAIATWDRIYDVTAFFVGSADDLTVHDYAALARARWGGLPPDAVLAQDSEIDAFIAAAKLARRPAILSGPIAPGEDPKTATQAFRFMGQRYIPDSDIFQQLVYDQVSAGYTGKGVVFTELWGTRQFPRGLDIPAALGSARATDIVAAEGDAAYGEPGTPGSYAAQLDKVRAQFAVVPAGQWTGNLYWSWLHSLGSLLEPRAAGFPYFMRQPAWVDKSLQTWLGSWTELRHDAILYAKPSASVPVSAPFPPDQGYVEPDPWLWARLAARAGQMRAGLASRGLLDPDTHEDLETMALLALALKAISEKELRGEPLAEADVDLINGIAVPLARFERGPQDSDDSSSDLPIGLVADVHSVYDARLALEEAVGDGFLIYVIVPAIDPAGKVSQWLAVGGAFSYYEFKQPLADRLTDEAWGSMAPRPDRPGWTESFIVAP